MILIVARFTVKNGDEKKFLNLFNTLRIASNAEEGCIEYALHKNVIKPLTYCLIERWKNQATIDAHNRSEHFISIVPLIREITDAEVEVYQPL